MTFCTPDQISALLPNNCRKARNNAGLSQGAFAAQLGIKRCTYAAYEESRTMPSIKTCLAICALAGVTLHDFLTTKLI